MGSRADGAVGAMRAGGARACHQQRQHAAGAGHELPGHHHHSRRQHRRGQRLPGGVVFGGVARSDGLRDRKQLRSGWRGAAARCWRAATRPRRSAAWRSTAAWRGRSAAWSRRSAAASCKRPRPYSAPTATRRLPASGLPATTRLRIPAARLPAPARLLLSARLPPLLPLRSGLLPRPVLLRAVLAAAVVVVAKS